MYLLQLENLAVGWEIMWRGMAGIFAAIAVIVVVVWLFTVIGNRLGQAKQGSQDGQNGQDGQNI